MLVAAAYWLRLVTQIARLAEWRVSWHSYVRFGSFAAAKRTFR
jgi:hypothetical protein